MPVGSVRWSSSVTSAKELYTLFSHSGHQGTKPRPPAPDRWGDMVHAPWLRILVIQQLRGLWVARGLEHDISAENRSMERAIDAVVGIAQAHSNFDRRHGRVALSSLPAAPRWCWTAYQHATPLRTVPAAGQDAPGGSHSGISIAIAPDGWALPMSSAIKEPSSVPAA